SARGSEGGGAAQHPQGPRLLAGPPPRLGLRPPLGVQQVLAVGPGDDPRPRRGVLAHGPAGPARRSEDLSTLGWVFTPVRSVPARSAPSRPGRPGAPTRGGGRGRPLVIGLQSRATLSTQSWTTVPGGGGVTCPSWGPCPSW